MSSLRNSSWLRASSDFAQYLAAGHGVAEVDEEAGDGARLLGPDLDIIPGDHTADGLHGALHLAHFRLGHRDREGLDGGRRRPLGRGRLGVGLAAGAEPQEEDGQAPASPGARTPRTHRSAVYRMTAAPASPRPDLGACRKMVAWRFSALP